MKTIAIIAGVGLIIFLAAAGMFAVRYQKMAESIKSHHQKISAWDLRNVPDGTYAGNFKEFLVSVNLVVTVKNNRIVDLQIADQQSGPGYEARETLERILKAQQPRVDAVTGATGSSMAIMIAADRAINKAAR